MTISTSQPGCLNQSDSRASELVESGDFFCCVCFDTKLSHDPDIGDVDKFHKIEIWKIAGPIGLRLHRHCLTGVDILGGGCAIGP
jgi:hypothetical protein